MGARRDGFSTVNNTDDVKIGIDLMIERKRDWQRDIGFHEGMK